MWVLSHIVPAHVECCRLAQHGAQLVLDYPLGGLLDVFFHYWCSGSHHPAVFGALAHLCSHLLGLLTVPYCHEVAGVAYVAHRFLPVFLLKAVAWMHLAIRVDEEVHHSGLARQHAAVAFNVIDKAHVEPSAEP